MICVLVSVVFVSCSVQEYFINDNSKARMITIGMDYENSVAAPTLTGTVDDAYEMAAAVKSIMNGKNIDFEAEYLVQEGFDYLFEVHYTEQVGYDYLLSVRCSSEVTAEAESPADSDSSDETTTTVTPTEDSTEATTEEPTGDSTGDSTGEADSSEDDSADADTTAKSDEEKIVAILVSAGTKVKNIIKYDEAYMEDGVKVADKLYYAQVYTKNDVENLITEIKTACPKAISEYQHSTDTIKEGFEEMASGSDATVSHISTYRETGEYVIRVQVNSKANAESYKTELEDIYSPSVSCRYHSLRDGSSYPSKANIIKAIKNASDLNESDLLVVYYSGHGETANVIPDSELRSILGPYVQNNKLTIDQYDTLMNLDMKSESEILGMMYLMGIAESVRTEIYNECQAYLLVNTHMQGSLVTAPVADYEYFDFLDMEYVYTLLSDLKCKVVFIVDACYSGFASASSFSGVSLKDSLESFMQSKDYPNVVVMAASTQAQTSKVSSVMTEDKVLRRHSAFTIKFFEVFNWVHSTKDMTYISVPYYTVNSDGTLNETTDVRGVEGYMSSLPARATVGQLFQRITADWAMVDQTPQKAESGYEICLIP